MRTGARALGVLCALTLAVPVALGGCVALLGAAADPSGGTGALGAPPGTAAVPAAWSVLEQEAAATCPGLPWTVLAAIGRVVSDSGRATPSAPPGGGATTGGLGPLDFSPAAFTGSATAGPGGAVPPSPLDAPDAVFTLAAFECRVGGANPATLGAAVFAFLADQRQVGEVEVLAGALAALPSLGSPAATAILFAASSFGIPYVWGGTGPDGYDCSGLVQAAYRAGGVTLPRVAQDQYDAGPLVGAAAARPGDLVFFGTSVHDVSHVGLLVAPGVMIDAPYTGVVVREDAVPVTVGAGWGGEFLVGLTRPGT